MKQKDIQSENCVELYLSGYSMHILWFNII